MISRRQLLQWLFSSSSGFTLATISRASVSRQWTVTGNAVPDFAAFDAAIQTFMKANGVRAGTLAILKNGDCVFAHGYTWAAPDYPKVQPSTLFRLASCSKAFTCAAIYSLTQSGRLDLTARVFPLLSLMPTAEPRLNEITVRELVDHTGGWNQATAPNPFAPGIFGFDPVFHIRDIARALGLTRPPTSRAVAQFMLGQPLQSPPGSTDHYSNFGYLLLGLVIEKASGQTYYDYLRKAVLAPLGIAEDVFVARTERSKRLSREVTYDQPGAGLSPLFPNRSVWAPYPYGGEGYMTEVMAAGGGLAATATALAQLAHHYQIWGLGLRLEPGNWSLARSGAMAGTSSLAVSRGKDSVDYAYIFNTRDFSLVPDALTTLNDTLGKLCDSFAWT